MQEQINLFDMKAISRSLQTLLYLLKYFMQKIITLIANIIDICSLQTVIWNIAMGNCHFWG
jgi:hypothetical protein